MSSYRKFLRNQTLPGMMEMETGMQKGLPLPPIQKPYPTDAQRIDLTPHEQCRALTTATFTDMIHQRRSRRIFTGPDLTFDELSYLLWATQGVQGFLRDGLVTMRTVPSGGGMHPFESYVAVHRVDGLAPGLYRYLAIEHQLLPLETEIETLPTRLTEACNGQPYVGNASAVFIWSVRPGRTEWRYGDDSLKDLLMSVGHICQNLYLACESIGAGTCATVAYQQDALDDILGLDGEDEIALYVAPVGKEVPGAN